jgi:SAM-dependent methyltransferase
VKEKGDPAVTNQPPPPPPTVDLVGPVVKTRAIIAAGQLGLFKLLADGPRTISEIASALGASETGVTLLAEALASIGYLEHLDGRFGNGPVARAWLTPESRVDFTPLLFWIGNYGWHALEELDQVIRRGEPERPLYEYIQDHPELGQTNAAYMQALAKLSAGSVPQMVTVPGTARRLLDLGGSHGLYSIAFCKHHPDLEAVVYDLPAALTDTGAALAAEGLAGRVSLQHGNYLTDDIGNGYDVILCFSLMHNHKEDDNKRLAAKIARALNPGGMVVVNDFLRGEPPDAFNALYSLLFFMYSATRNYSYPEITGWLAEAGLSGFNRIDLPPGGQASLITAVKAG